MTIKPLVELLEVKKKKRALPTVSEEIHSRVRTLEELEPSKAGPSVSLYPHQFCRFLMDSCDLSSKLLVTIIRNRDEK